MQQFEENQLNINKLQILCLDRTGADLDISEADEEFETGPDKTNKLVCHVCGHEITTHSLRIPVLGRNIHSKINPHGFAYHFICFSHAPGCVVTGQPSSEHTWFSGYAWQVASCKQCLEHLGWRFCGDSVFFGLIQGRIVEVGKD